MSRGWVSVNGCIFSYYCYLILFIMSCFFLVSGALFTAIAYRPQQMSEKLGEWSYHWVQSRKIEIAGPAFLLLGSVMAVFSVILCHVSRRVNPTKDSAQLVPKLSRVGVMTGSDRWTDSKRIECIQVISAFSVVQNEEKSYFEPGYSDMSSLIVTDIACFPQGNTPRAVSPCQDDQDDLPGGDGESGGGEPI